jgi:lipid-binding SYLF domain-containing protein
MRSLRMPHRVSFDVYGRTNVMRATSCHAAMRRRSFLIGSGASLGLVAVAGCSTTSSSSTPAEASAKKREIDAGVDATLTRLYGEIPGSQELLQKSKGVLVFPQVLAAGVGIGGEYGEGALRSGGRTIDYYKTTTGSLGFQLGAQSKAIIIAFMTDPAYQQFRNSSGWTAGADASVALLKVGANGRVDTSTATEPVVGFVLTNSGLMFNLSLAGTKVSKLEA